MRFCLNGLRASRKRVRALRARVSRWYYFSFSLNVCYSILLLLFFLPYIYLFYRSLSISINGRGVSTSNKERFSIRVCEFSNSDNDKLRLRSKLESIRFSWRRLLFERRSFIGGRVLIKRPALTYTALAGLHDTRVFRICSCLQTKSDNSRQSEVQVAL